MFVAVITLSGTYIVAIVADFALEVLPTLLGAAYRYELN